MIPPEWRIWVESGALFPGGPHTWHVIDWDQRRWFAVTGSEQALPDEDEATNVMQKLIDSLGPEVSSFEISDDGTILSTSSDPEKDVTQAVLYPHYPGYLDETETLTRSQLQEIDRLGPCADLVCHREKLDGSEKPEKSKLAVFKYPLIWQHRQKVWDELHIIKGLRAHPFVVPFDRIILDDVEKRVLGFTTAFVPGGDLEHNPSRPFRFSWLEQLTSVIDDLNLKYGIMHHDVAPRNLLIDPTTNTLKLFDFDRAAKIGTVSKTHNQNDVDGVIFTLYEILTLDHQYRDIPFWEQDVTKVEKLREWPVKAAVEDGSGGIPAFRRYLDQWAENRRTVRTIEHYTEATDPLDWPGEPPGTPWKYFAYRNDDGTPVYEVGVRMERRIDARKRGRYVVDWERPAQKDLPQQSK
ncbi:MAG: hypothetical protein M1819_003603 [Sarea resinae]|nr:MAG: hypothetical protein M1819_003603 [Sarea resinae]